MTAVLLLAIGVVFSIGVITGTVILVSMASRTEDHRPRLGREAPDRMTNAGRRLTGLYVRRPGDDPWHDDSEDDPDDDYVGHSGPRQDPWA